MDKDFSPPVAGSAPHTPIRMNIIEEEEDANSPPVLGLQGLAVNSPAPALKPLVFSTDTTPGRRPTSLYSLQGGNDSSSSLVATKGFTFGGGNGLAADVPQLGENSAQTLNLSTEDFHTHAKRHSFKYIPAPKLPPVSRNRSPVRHNRSPSPERKSKRNSLLMETPFNFNSSALQPAPLSGSSSNSGPSAGSANGGTSRSAVFRKGHRYKHSSVSMNFFQEPEVKEPLNIIKSLPVPDFKDLRNSLTWPTTHIQISICFIEILISIFIFNLGHQKGWSSLSTLCHFLSYDVLGGIFAIVTELLSKFEIWKTGTITLPFGLNRIDVLLSFAFSISICFAGLDLIFHVLEEIAVIFAEESTKDHHDEINQTIPHSHHTHLHQDQLTLWYSVIAVAATISFLSYHFIFKTTQYKIKNPLITLSYLLYMSLYPVLSHYHRGWDMLATAVISIFIMSYGIQVAKWTSTILLMGFSTASVNSSLLVDEDLQESNTGVSERMILKRSNSALPFAAVAKNNSPPTSVQLDPTFVKSKIYESILSLPSFKNACSLKNNDLLISKVNFQMFVVLLRIEMKNVSNDDELDLRLAIDKLIREYVPNVETTIEIKRM
ncbi:unnamed protein product [Kluyveromyces dobzhanskii CBS 2104]|uniref:WGS project CCBQ000000000 data, contig 00015 n=1 Tax=Kluyveromyces dobzhanskii CBS 2104 TaxID=1427455 RepID=A0A0A8LC03_9SACH|nr:unnamed protein product [Kluyveromyces dobzhanskii CBS 2104]